MRFRGQLDGVDLAREPQLFERPDAVPIEVDLVPREAVARRNRVRMVIVVPAFAEGEQSHPPAIRRKIAGLKAPRTDHVRGRIDQPRRMKTEDGAEEDPPHDKGHSSDGEKHNAKHDHGHVMVFRDPDVKFVLGQIGNVMCQRLRVVVHRFAGEYPAHVRPPGAVDRRVRIAFLVGMLVVNAVRRYPEYRPAFESKRGTDRQQILDPFGSLVPPVSQQPVVRHADPRAARHPVQKERNEKCLPGEEEQRRHRADVKQNHESGCNPVDPAVLRRLFSKIVYRHVALCSRLGSRVS